MKHIHLHPFIIFITGILLAASSPGQTPVTGSIAMTVKNPGPGSSILWLAPEADKVLGFDEDGQLAVLTVTAANETEWGSITGTLTDQSDLQAALNTKAPLASPTFTGTVTIPPGASIAGYLTESEAQATYASLTGTYSDPPWITSLAKSKTGLGNVENTALSTWTGTSTLTTLGTITAGTWQGTPIADTHIASASNWNSKASQEDLDNLSALANAIDVALGDLEAVTVKGPAGASDNALARFDGTTGKLLQTSLATLSDTGYFFTPEQIYSSDQISAQGDLYAGGDVIMGNSGTYLRSGGGEFNLAIFPDKGGAIRYVPLVESAIGLVDVADEITGTLPIANGGTGAITASTARANLGLVIGEDILAPNGSAANLTSFPILNQSTTGSAASLSGGDVDQIWMSDGAGSGSWINYITDLENAASGTLPLGNGGTGSALTDPNSDRLLFWDESAGEVTWLTLGVGVSITGTTLSASSGGGGGEVVGAASSTDNALARFDSTTGKVIQNSTATLDDSGALTLPGPVSITGGGNALSVTGNVSFTHFASYPHMSVNWPVDGAMTVSDAFQFIWSFNGSYFDGGDVGIKRASPGILKITDASTGYGRLDALAYQLGGGPSIQSGTSSPESAVAAPVGSIFTRTDGSAGTTLYIKESGTGNTGWTALGTGSGGGSGGATSIWIDASAMIPRVTTGAGVNSSETATHKVNYDTLDFNAGSQEYAQKIEVLPDNWSAGTITATFYWTASSGSGDVVWSMAARSLANDDALDTARGTAQTVTDTFIAAGDMHVTSATSAVTIAGTPAVGAPVILEFSRVSGDGADTLAVDARLIGVLVTY